jgi:flagellar P-ring protein precursor FlgI
MLERLGINTRGKAMDTKNTAAVVITAHLPAFARQGTRIDVTISSLGDAKSLLGGTLLVTPLLAADGEVYAVSQGAVQASGFSASSSKGTGTSVTKGVPTSGYIPNGAIVEREVGYELNEQRTLRLALRNPDFTTAQRIANTINRYVDVSTAKALDSGTIEVMVPAQYQGNLVPFITMIESLKVDPDQTARVILDDREGIIVLNENVRISTVAIAHGSLVVKVVETQDVSQPGAFSSGTTQVTGQTNITVTDGEGKQLGILNQGATLRELVDGLNALGTTPRDTIAILQSIKAAGALQADISEL